MRFTRDGDEKLEALLAQSCREIGLAMQSLVPKQRLQALVLGGGYGRGEGGVLATDQGDAPYNDLEFFVFIAGPPRLNERRYGAGFHALEQRMSERLGIDVEFKILSLEKLRSAPTTMFYYDLVTGHHVVTGDSDVLQCSSRHAEASRIPLHEATRLLMNRCSGLLFAAERLTKEDFTSADADFVARNIAKAKLALGDVILAGLSRYHWSCLKRHEQLAALEDSALPLQALRDIHAVGVEFKLHPKRSTASREDLAQEHQDLCGIAWRVWQWLEGKRLGVEIKSPLHYTQVGNKCPETSVFKNPLIRLRAFGLRGLLSAHLFAYPREVLLNSLPLLLWEQDKFSAQIDWLSSQFCRLVSSRREALAAYIQLWAKFN